jgi:dTDP-4-amino-4,6-dideoxygalactose transaminase
MSPYTLRPDTLNLDETLVAEKTTKKTRAIVPVHYGGEGGALVLNDAKLVERSSA